MALNIYKKGLLFPKPYQMVKNEKYGTFSSLTACHVGSI